MKIGRSVLLVVVVLAVPASSFATTEGPTAGANVRMGPAGMGPAIPAPAPSEPPAPGRWYGWELMASDVFFLLMANDGRIDNPELGLGKHQFALGLSGLIVGAPALHLLHGNRRRAAFGLAVRAFVVGVYAVADASLRTSDASSSSPSGDGGAAGIDSGDFVMAGVLVGSIVGGLAYVFVDDVWHARVPAAAPVRPQATLVAPTFFLNRRGGGLGLMAAF